ncbi:MAG: hypothetical protein OFPII_42600 [Osedax symbiont Rs1]|nr:MAG: hypothetical protein OFPII_42600 [Osedax symbiont Rs1]
MKRQRQGCFKNMITHCFKSDKALLAKSSNIDYCSLASNTKLKNK